MCWSDNPYDPKRHLNCSGCKNFSTPWKNIFSSYTCLFDKLLPFDLLSSANRKKTTLKQNKQNKRKKQVECLSDAAYEMFQNQIKKMNKQQILKKMDEDPKFKKVLILYNNSKKIKRCRI